MEKLIELLNEYETDKHPARSYRNYYLGFVHNYGAGIMYIDTDGEYIDDYRIDYEIVSKEYGFIKWLVENDKLDEEELQLTLCDELKRFYKDYEILIMQLSISDNPIQDLISLLK